MEDSHLIIIINMKIICKPISMQGNDKWYSKHFVSTAGILCFWPFLLPLLLTEVHQKLNSSWGNLPEWNVRSHFLRKLISRIVIIGSRPLSSAGVQSVYELVTYKASVTSITSETQLIPESLSLATALINIPGTKIHGYKNHVTIIS